MTLPYQNTLIECPHSLSSEKEIARYQKRIDFCFQHKSIPLLMPELSKGSSPYLAYADFLWRWDQDKPEEISGEYDSPPLEIIESDPLIGLFTSGSSGSPKLIWHRLSHYHQAAKRSANLLGIKKSTKLLSALPCYHNGGFLNLIRAKVIPHSLTISPHKELIPTWKELRPDIVVGVPTQLQQALEQIDDLNGTTFYCGGAALDSGLWQQALERGMKVYGTYGLTESCGAILYKENPTAAYKALEGIEISLSPKNHLQFTSPSNALAIQVGSKITSAQVPWVTADLAAIDSAGVHILGRSDQIILCSGENISPQEILNYTQAFLTDHHVNGQIQVVGMPDKVKGQIPVVLIAGLENWEQGLRNQLIHSLREGMSPLQRPRFLMGTLNPTKGIKITPADVRSAYDQQSTEIWKV